MQDHKPNTQRRKITLKGTQSKQGNMDILKKFRYNFHYWLRNCYQVEELRDPKDGKPTIVSSQTSPYNKQTTHTSTKATSVYSKEQFQPNYKITEQDFANMEKVKSFSQTARLKDLDTEKDPKTLKFKPDKYMVL